jgi:hypothetical protein
MHTPLLHSCTNAVDLPFCTWCGQVIVCAVVPYSVLAEIFQQSQTSGKVLQRGDVFLSHESYAEMMYLHV